VSVYKAIIVGTGFSGICQAIKLKEVGINDFLILEKADSVGGTWRENTYPGAECDIPSALYSYSFAPNPNWKHKWSHQDQILEYINYVVDHYEIRPYIRYGQEVKRAHYDQITGQWSVKTQDKQYICESLIVAIGQLHHPAKATFKNQELFKGLLWHSARWRHDVNLSGLRVGVIGNAASAVQFIPEIAKVVGHLTVFQRSANWMIPKVEPETSDWVKKINGRFPFLMKLTRLRIWLMGGLMFFLMGDNAFAKKMGTANSLSHLKKQVKDPELRRKLTPDYPIGAKRILFSDNYYPALCRENVHLETAAIDQFTESSIITNDGVEHPLDVVIYSTGFVTNPFLKDIDIAGLEGIKLSDQWKDGAEAYLGINVAGFPNFYMMYGPNTNLGHNSIIIMSEAQAHYITSCIIQKEEKKWKSIDVKRSIQDQYNQEMQDRLKSMAWNQLEKSWYRIDGKITNNWPGRTMEYARRTKKVNWGHYQCS
jgi:cation diffusion facilitator CzcD-associated flavoprotein CzcO